MITKYDIPCDYRLGGLKNKVYLVTKDGFDIKIKAKGTYVEAVNTKGKVIAMDCGGVKYNQKETYEGKFRFASTLEISINELFEEPFFYGLDNLRKNQYYIVIEDKKGTQYLCNPELHTKLTYEYTFTNNADEANAVVLTFENLSNFPLLILKKNVSSEDYVLKNQCNYNLGITLRLLMCHKGELKVNDDTVKATEIYLNDANVLKDIEFLEQTLKCTQSYNGKDFTTKLEFSIPLDAYKFTWHYDLIEFKKNVYSSIIHTHNNNFVICDNLFPSYTINTSENVGNPNMVNFTFTSMSQRPWLYCNSLRQYRWIEDGTMCFGFDKYTMLKRQYTDDFGESWNDSNPIVKKKGELIEKNSEDCKDYRWVADGEECISDGVKYIRWVRTDGFLCENGNKYHKTRKQVKENNVWTNTDEYGIGDLIETNSNECSYVAIRWVKTNNMFCIPVDETYTKKSGEETFGCENTDYYKYFTDLVSNNGVDYYPSNTIYKELVKKDCCACGAVQATEWRAVGEPYCQGYNKYQKFEEYKICKDEYADVDEKSGNTKTEVIETNSCDCGYVGYEWRISDPLESVCRSKNKYAIWYEYNTCTDEKTGKTQERLYIKNSCDCGYRTEEWRISDPLEVVCGRDINNAPSGTSLYGKYQVWYKWLVCSDIEGNAEEKTEEKDYRLIESNSCDCGYRVSEWRISEPLETICGSVLYPNDVKELYKEYAIYYEWLVCGEYEEKTDVKDYRLIEDNSCNCGYRTYKEEFEKSMVGQDVKKEIDK